MTNGEGYQNGSIGVVTNFIEDDNEDCVLVQFNSHFDPIIVHPHTWNIYSYLKLEGHYQKTRIGEYSQIPLRLGYAITIHKSQGQTYERVNVQPAGWTYGLLYVSLSRVTSIKGMYLTNRITSKLVKASPYVKSFYQNLG